MLLDSFGIIGQPLDLLKDVMHSTGKGSSGAANFGRMLFNVAEQAAVQAAIAKTPKVSTRLLKDALKGAVGQDRVELAWATVEQESMRTGKENFTLGYETGVDAVATDAAMAEICVEINK